MILLVVTGKEMIPLVVVGKEMILLVVTGKEMIPFVVTDSLLNLVLLIRTTSILQSDSFSTHSCTSDRHC